MIEIALNSIEKYYGANHILKDVSFEVKSLFQQHGELQEKVERYYQSWLLG